MKNKLSKNKKGFSLVEILIYVAGMVLIIGLVGFLISQIYGIYREITVEQRIDRVGISVVDFMTREIRRGEYINIGESILNVANGTLSLNTIESGNDIKKVFSIDNNRVAYEIDDGGIEYLSPENLNVTGLSFTQIVTPISTAIRYNLDIEYNTKDGLQTRSYNGLAILRYSYD